MRTILYVMAILMCVAHSAVAQVGFAQFNIQTERGDPIPVTIWYPTDEETAQIVRGPFMFQGVENATPRSGPHPLVVISHGSGSGSLTHVNLAVYLTDAGYIVAALTHGKDNFLDASGSGTVSVIRTRAEDVSTTIDRISAPNPLDLVVDNERVAVVGFSAGGTTALALTGLRPSMAEAVRHCAAYADPFCRFVDASDPRFNDTGLMLNLTDSRIQSAVVLAPVTAYFSDAELAMLEHPVFVFAPEKDTELSPMANAGRLRDLVQNNLTFYEERAAGHYSILPVFSPTTSDDVPLALRSDNEGFDRAAFHSRIFGRVVNFLDETLKR